VGSGWVGHKLRTGRKSRCCANIFLPLLAELELFASQTHGLSPWATLGRRSAAQGKTWAGVTVVPSEQIGLSPTFLME